MFRRILFSTAAAATLLAAAPAFAAEHASAKTQPCSCCSDGSVHQSDHKMREQNVKPSTNQQATQSEDPDIRNQSFGG